MGSTGCLLESLRIEKLRGGGRWIHRAKFDPLRKPQDQRATVTAVKTLLLLTVVVVKASIEVAEATCRVLCTQVAPRFRKVGCDGGVKFYRSLLNSKD